MSGPVCGVACAGADRAPIYPAGANNPHGPMQAAGPGASRALDGVIRGAGRLAAAGLPDGVTQQHQRENAQHQRDHQLQQIREAKEHRAAQQAQREREAREHGVQLQDQPVPAIATGAAIPALQTAQAPQANQTDAQGSGISSRSGNVASPISSAPVSLLQAAAASPVHAGSTAPVQAGGMIGPGTHPLRPVPQNGGEHQERPTTIADINAVIKDIDPSLLANSSQAGQGALKGLPYGKMFEAAGKATGIDPSLLYADAQVETGDNKNGRVLVPNNINPIQTAPGVWPTTANAATNLFTGAYVMRDYIDRAGGDLKRGLNAYNTGNLAPGEKGFADGYAGYYEGVMAAHANVQKAIADPSIIQPGQGDHVTIASQI